MQTEQLTAFEAAENPYRALYDRIGLVASSLCAVHCILMPWLLLLLPILVGTIFTDARFENVFVAISILLASFCGYMGCLKHGKWGVMIPITIGALVLFTVRLSAPPICCLDDVSWSHAIGSAFGGSFLAASHFLNLKFSHQVEPKENSPCCPSTDCSAHE